MIRFDKMKLFWYPVNSDLVPDYSHYVKKPMDFQTMQEKLDAYKYKSLQDFKVNQNHV